MKRRVKHIIAAFFVCLMISKGIYAVIVSFSQHQYAGVVSQPDTAEPENSEKESEQKSGEKGFVTEEITDIVLPVIIAVQRSSHGHYISAAITHLTDLAVFTPPPELA
ncbi:MAG: hypothetical protein QM768_01310 [Agriterribacter sp.]